MQVRPVHQRAVVVVHRQGDGVVGHALAALCPGHIDGGDLSLEDVAVPVRQVHKAARLDEGDVPVVHGDGDQHGHVVGDHNHRVAALHLLALGEVAGGDGAVDGGHGVKVAQGLHSLVQVLHGLVDLLLLGADIGVDSGGP